MKPFESLGLKHDGNRLLVLDQTRLPHDEIWLECRSPDDMIGCIRRLAVRGAPLIGVAAAVSLAKFAESGASQNERTKAAEAMAAARPTAVNLVAAVERLLVSPDWTSAAEEIFDEDVALCEGMASHGATLFESGEGVLTHCNTGGLATVGVGTALGVIRRAFEQGKKLHVYVDETRPLLQGARLTTWELQRLRIPFTLICDNMAAALMMKGFVQKAITGADRIAMNGDFANKIGTYSVAVNAHHHGIPFFVAAPMTTVDLRCETGADIPIEERAAEEVRGGAAKDCAVYNPAFDVTPAKLVGGYVLDKGFFKTAADLKSFFETQKKRRA